MLETRNEDTLFACLAACLRCGCLQALMEQWRAELQRKPLSMSEGQACEALGLAPGPDGRVEEDDMRRAYRALARR